jgi:hypothetical protein
MTNKFDFLCDNISGIDYDNSRFGKCDENGVSAWYHENSYNEFTMQTYKRDKIEFDVDGVKYYEHWFFVNELHNSSVVGYSLMNEDGDIQFCVVGCRTDFVCDFDTMYKYLTNESYYID